MRTYASDGVLYNIPSYTDEITEKGGATKAFTDFADSMPNITNYIDYQDNGNVTINLSTALSNKVIGMTTFADVTINVPQTYTIANGSQFVFFFNQDAPTAMKKVIAVPGDRVTIYPQEDLEGVLGGVPLGLERGWPFTMICLTKLYSMFNKDYYHIANSCPPYKTPAYNWEDE